MYKLLDLRAKGPQGCTLRLHRSLVITRLCAATTHLSLQSRTTTAPVRARHTQVELQVGSDSGAARCAWYARSHTAEAAPLWAATDRFTRRELSLGGGGGN